MIGIDPFEKIKPDISLVPRYKNYGGPGHCGWDYIWNPYIWNPLTQDNGDYELESFQLDPYDAADTYFMYHDIDYDNALDKTTNKVDYKKILEADMKLLYNIGQLQPNSPQYPDNFYGKLYIPVMIKVFELKLLADLGSIDDLNETEKKNLFDTLKQTYPVDVDIPEVPFIDPISIPDFPDYPGYQKEFCETAGVSLPDWLVPWVDTLGTGLERVWGDIVNALRRLSKRNPDDNGIDGLSDMIAPWVDLFHDAEETPNYVPGPSGISPLVLDLDRDGVETTSLTAGAYFDHDCNGFAELTSWAASDDGLLVMDRDNDGIIEDGTELFGDQTILQSGQKATDGFQALAELDGNLDGKIDASDTVWNQLKVWQDIDGDGYSSADELYSLDELGIKSISTGHSSSTYVDSNGNEHREIGSFTWNDETTSSMNDVWFIQNKTYTIANEWLDVPETIEALPDLQGFGNVYDLHQAMVRDTSGQLQSLVEQFIAASDVSVRESLMEQIMFKWTGVDSIDPASRGIFMDARKLVALENYFCEQFLGVEETAGNDNPKMTHCDHAKMTHPCSSQKNKVFISSLSLTEISS